MLQCLFENHRPLTVCGFTMETRGGVEGDGIDMTHQPAQFCGQFFGNFRCVIDAIDQRPFKGDAAAGLRNIIFTSVEHFIDLVAFVDRHHFDA